MRLARRWFWVLVVLSLVAAACTGGDGSTDGGDDTEAGGDPAAESDGDGSSDGDNGDGSGGGDGSDSDAAPAAPTAGARGVTDDTITIGYSYLDFEILQQLGLTPGGWGDQELVFQSLVDDLNANGGIHGRQVEVIYEAYSPLGTQDAEAVCLRLTEDNETFAVLGGFLGPAEPANTCIAGRQGTVLVGGIQTAERLAETTAPWITDRPPRARLAGILLNLLDQQGQLDGRNVAVVTNVDAAETRDGVVAALADVGIEPVENLLSEAPIGDVVAEDNVWASLLERIRTAGADTVLLVGNPSSGIRNIGSQGLDVDVWVIDQESLLNLGSTLDLELARGAMAAAPLTGQSLWEHETMAGCIDIFTGANPDVDVIEPADLQEGEDDYPQALSLGCRFLRLFQAVAEAAGPELTNQSFAEAAAGMTQFSVPGQPFASFASDKFDSNDSYQLVSFNPDIGANGGFDPITEITDVTP